MPLEGRGRDATRVGTPPTRSAWLNRDLLRHLRLSAGAIDRVVDAERRELRRRELAYRGMRPPLPVVGCTVILVDDGLATGSTMRAAVMAVERQHAARVVVAVPVASHDAVEPLSTVADEVVRVLTPEPFDGVGAWYVDFAQTSDAEVRALLASAWTRTPRRSDASVSGASGASGGSRSPPPAAGT